MDFKIFYLLYFNDGLGFLCLQLLLGKLDFINSLLKSIVRHRTTCPQVGGDLSKNSIDNSSEKWKVITLAGLAKFYTARLCD